MFSRLLHYLGHKALDLLASALDNILHIVLLTHLIILEREQDNPNVSTVLMTYFLAWFATAFTRRIKAFRGCDDFVL